MIIRDGIETADCMCNLSFFSPDGKFLVFLSAKSSVDSGAHSATDSLHRIEWPADGELCASTKIVDVVSSTYYLIGLNLIKSSGRFIQSVALKPLIGFVNVCVHHKYINFFIHISTGTCLIVVYSEILEKKGNSEIYQLSSILMFDLYFVSIFC